MTARTTGDTVPLQLDTPLPRRRNPEQTRKAIVDAALAALHDGEMAPTTRSIAARAGTSERSIFIHFPDREELRIAVAHEQAAQVEVLIAAIDANLPLAQRIDAAVRQGAAIFALQHTPRLVGLLEAHIIPAISTRMRVTENLERSALAATFAPELTRNRAFDDELLDLIAATLGWPYHYRLVDRYGMSPTAASDAIRRALTAMLAPETE